MAHTVNRVIVLMLENRSFDQMLGNLTAAYPEGEFDGLPCKVTNPDASGDEIEASDDAVAKFSKSPDHRHEGVIHQLTGPEKGGTALTNRGFVASFAAWNGGDGHAIMDCFAPAKVPVLTSLGRAFAVCQRWFCSVPGETWPNRNYVHAATSDGEVDIVGRPYWRETIFDKLESHGHEWAVYHRGPAQVWVFPSVWQLPFKRRRRFKELAKLPDDIRAGRLAAYTFVEPDHGIVRKKESNSQHPSSNVGDGRDFYAGEQLILDIYRALVETPSIFNETLFVVTYDEHGGFFDHVHPPLGEAPAVAPDDKDHDGFRFDLLGPRVPAVLISPWIPTHRVDPTVYDHSAVPASIKERFMPEVGHLTRRDAASMTFWHNLSLDKPRSVEDLPDPARLQAMLDEVSERDQLEFAVAAANIGQPSRGLDDVWQPLRTLDDMQRELLSLAVRVDAAISSVPSDSPVPDEVADIALRGDAVLGGFIKPAGEAAIEAAVAPGLVNENARAAYLEGMVRRFRE